MYIPELEYNYSLGSCFFFLRFFLGASSSSLRRMHPKYTAIASPNVPPEHKSTHNIRVSSTPLDELSLPMAVSLRGKQLTKEITAIMKTCSTIHNINESKNENEILALLLYSDFLHNATRWRISSITM